MARQWWWAHLSIDVEGRHFEEGRLEFSKSCSDAATTTTRNVLSDASTTSTTGVTIHPTLRPLLPATIRIIPPQRQRRMLPTMPRLIEKAGSQCHGAGVSVCIGFALYVLVLTSTIMIHTDKAHPLDFTSILCFCTSQTVQANSRHKAAKIKLTVVLNDPLKKKEPSFSHNYVSSVRTIVVLLDQDFECLSEPQYDGH